MNQGDNNSRPEVLNNASETQMQELEQQFAENDHDAWKTLTGSYGWSDSDSQAVWDWFGEKPEEGGSGKSGEQC